MGYCTVDDMQRILPEKISIGDDNIGTPVPGRTQTKRSNITPSEAERYIEYSQQHIDSRLRNFYSCPLRRTKSFETDLGANVSSGTNVSITVNDSGVFVLGNLVRLQDNDTAAITPVKINNRNFDMNTP